MIEIELNAEKSLAIQHLVLDYNGTIAQDGELIAGVEERLQELSKLVQIHVLTADTHGSVEEKVASISCHVHVIDKGGEDRQKCDYLTTLDGGVVAIGNGRNDTLMLEFAAVGIAVLQTEGLSARALHCSDVLVKDIVDALNLLLLPKRLIATLRN